VKTRNWKRTHIYGVALPHSFKEAYAIDDDQTGTRFWHDAIVKEMSNVMLAFEFYDDNKPPLGHIFIPCHMIFNIKSDLTRKARLVAGGHITDEPHKSVYLSVVCRDSVRIAFTIASLNGLRVFAGDVQMRISMHQPNNDVIAQLDQCKNCIHHCITQRITSSCW
jgi:hypothetical protein